MKITDDIKYIGVNDRELDLFESQFPVPNGMAYNSYVIIDEKTAVMDSVEIRFKSEWMENLERALDGREPDYLIVHHMEPDHSANISAFMNKYPKAVIVASSRAFPLMSNFFGTDFADRRIQAADNDTLSLGKHNLRFIYAPMVHWPEVMFTYDETEGVLFSADAFGKFGALDTDEDWACEARRYYFGIVGKYGAQVQNVMKKLSGLDIKTICPLHGPVLTENLGYYTGLYDTWSSYGVESEGVVIEYTSVYGHTREAVELLAEELKKAGCPKVSVNDLARTDIAEDVEDAFRYGTVVLATTTYNGDIFPFMREFIGHLTERGFKNRRIALIENGSWAPQACRVMKSLLESSQGLTYAENSVTIRSALNDESRSQIAALAKELSR